MSRAITPSPRPNHSVHRRMSSVAAPPIVAEVVTSKRVSPNILPSAVPNPPGRPEADPIKDETDKIDRKSTRLNSSHTVISYAVFCLKKKKKKKKKTKKKQEKK